MSDEGFKLNYGKKKPITVWDVLPRAAVAAVLIAFPAVDIFSRLHPNFLLLILDVCFVILAVIVIIQLVRLYRR